MLGDCYIIAKARKRISNLSDGGDAEGCPYEFSKDGCADRVYEMDEQLEEEDYEE